MKISKWVIRILVLIILIVGLLQLNKYGESKDIAENGITDDKVVSDCDNTVMLLGVVRDYDETHSTPSTYLTIESLRDYEEHIEHHILVLSSTIIIGDTIRDGKVVGVKCLGTHFDNDKTVHIAKVITVREQLPIEDKQKREEIVNKLLQLQDGLESDKNIQAYFDYDYEHLYNSDYDTHLQDVEPFEYEGIILSKGINNLDYCVDYKLYINTGDESTFPTELYSLDYFNSLEDGGLEVLILGGEYLVKTEIIGKIEEGKRVRIRGIRGLYRPSKYFVQRLEVLAE